MGKYDEPFSQSFDILETKQGQLIIKTISSLSDNENSPMEIEEEHKLTCQASIAGTIS